MAAQIFKDEKLQALFNKQGFVTVPFINAEEVQALNNLFDQLHPQLPAEGFVSDSYSRDLDYKRKTSIAIVEVLNKHYERLFINYQPFGASFLFKIPSPNSQLSIHQDWTVVDENNFVALNCWIPLTDINETNGALHLVPGSHFSAYNTVRAPTLPFFFSGNDDVVIPAAIPMYVKAGEAVILDQSVIHYSPPNRSEKVRKALTAGVKSKGAPMRFHYKDPQKNDNQLEVFQMPEDFLISFDDFYKDISERPKMGTSIGYVNYMSDPLPRQEVSDLVSEFVTSAGFEIKTTAPVKNERKSLFKRLVEVFQ